MNIIDMQLLHDLLENRRYSELKQECLRLNVVDLANFIETIDKEKAILLFRTLPKETAAEVFAEFDPDMQEHIIGAITDQELHFIIEDLFMDDMVDMLEELPANVVKRVLKLASPDTRTLINQFLNYKENSAGSIMTAEYINLHKEMTVAEAFARIRASAYDKETIYTCYVTDASRHLQGVISVRALLVNEDDVRIEDIMESNIIYVHTDDDREDVASLLAKYDFLSIPVVDRENRLVGIVTVDDAVDIINEEATEDIYKMAAITPSETPYLKSSVFKLAQGRIVWLLVLMVSSMVTSVVLEQYEAAFAAIPLLVLFIPMITDTGGNAGSQSSTTIIRAMTLDEVHFNDALKVVWKELRVSILAGTLLCLVNYVRIRIQYPGEEGVALAVSLSVLLTVVLAKTVGCMLPMLAKKIKVDPALMAAPLITTIVDALALILYFSIAQAILQL